MNYNLSSAFHVARTRALTPLLACTGLDGVTLSPINKLQQSRPLDRNVATC